MELIEAALQFSKDLGLFFYVAPFLKQAKAIAWARLKQKLEPMRVTGAIEVNESELSVKFKHNGATIRLFGGDNPDAMRGVRLDGVVIDEVSYQAKVNGRPLDLTFKEFELLRFLAGHPQRVFTREQLLSEVWGYDYFGGTRTVDVHVRRLRAKLGDMESLIGTVRNVGYRFTVAESSDEVREKEESEARKSSEA